MNRQFNLQTMATMMAVTIVQGAQAAQLDLSWNTIDGGGISRSMGGKFELSGSAGQTDASGPMSGGALSLTGGFWPGAISSRPADCDGDFSLDLSDHQCLIECLKGPQPPAKPSAECLSLFDFDGDNAVDIFDAAEFMTQFDAAP